MTANERRTRSKRGRNRPSVGQIFHTCHVLVTRNDDGGSGIDYAAVGPDAVPPRRGRFHFETYSFVRWVLQLKVGGDYICEWTCTHTQFTGHTRVEISGQGEAAPR